MEKAKFRLKLRRKKLPISGINNYKIIYRKEMSIMELLIVDDQQGIRLLLNEVFKKEGFFPHLAATGQEALQIVETSDISLILLDMKIPGMDGIEILRRIKNIKPDIPVIMMTAYGELGVINEALDLGAVKYFTKPFDIFEVRDEVKKILAF